MSRALSIAAAARECGAAIALETSERAWAFDELAQLTAVRLRALDAIARDRPYPLIAANTLDTIVTIYALWERGIAPLLVHPRLTAPEREKVLAAAQRSGPLAVRDAAAVLHTSGTTGAPRAAILTHAALEASAAANVANMGWIDGDRWLLCMTLAHVGGLSILSRCLIGRKCVALADAFDATLLPQFIDAHDVTLLSLVPTMLARLLDAGWTRPRSVRAVLLGGAHASDRLLQRAAEARVPVLVTYGLTETCSQVTTTPYPARHDPRPFAAGRPLPGIEVRVRDGQIEVRGPVLMDRYWTEPPLRDAWFATGDIGSIDARGCLHVHARRDDVIVTGGENVHPLEVEDALEACPGVIAAGVFGIADELWGQTVVAAVVMEASTASEARLRDHVRAHLAPHKQPRRFVFVRELPLNRAGKLDRRALPQVVESLRHQQRASAGRQPG